MTIDGQSVRVGTTICIALAPDDGVGAERLLQHADIALYRGKAAGGRTWQRFTSDIIIEQSSRHTIEVDLRQALANDEFVLHFQPIVSVADRRFTTCEALLRWQHPVHGLLPPDAFIGVAERTGMIVDIGLWVLAEACRTAITWPKAVAIAVNMSAAQLRHTTVVTDVARVLTETGLDPSRLQIEVTESVMLASITVARPTRSKLHEIGVALVMDDFGSGYSSLTQLRAFRYERLKLDRSFIKTLVDEGDAMTIVRTVLVLGKELGTRVTVEGVETAEQLEILTRLGCPDVQGYLFGHPVDAESIGHRLAQGLVVELTDESACREIAGSSDDTNSGRIET